ncbi:Tyrosine recombinase XerA [uncultured archaeon]|nr:Tyrosine recombinase XerA [uncultured archaeon]
MYLNPMNEFKPLDEWANGDAIKYILKLQKTSKPSTVEAAKIIMKVYFKWLQKPDVVANIKIKNIKNNLKREDILTIEDINKLIETTDSHMYKALIALLFESGGRIGEILKIKVKDIQETDKGMIVCVPQFKTGNDYRRSPCVFSAQYIRNYITYCALNKNDTLFDLSEVAVWRVLKKIGKNSGIEKPVSAHKFRHAQATDMVIRGYQESIIKKKLGWTGSSRMIERYTHVADDDVINTTLEKATGAVGGKPLTTLKQPEAVKITEYSLQLSKLNEENEELRKRLEEGEKRMEKNQMELTGTILQMKTMMEFIQDSNPGIKITEKGVTINDPNAIKAWEEHMKKEEKDREEKNRKQLEWMKQNQPELYERMMSDTCSHKNLNLNLIETGTTLKCPDCGKLIQKGIPLRKNPGDEH